MSDLIKALRKAVEFKQFKYAADVATVALIQYEKGQAAENKRLQPLWEKVIAAIETLEQYACIYCVSYPNTTYPRCLEYQSCKALEELRLTVGEK